MKSKNEASVLESRICLIHESDFSDFNEIPANIDPKIAKSLRRFKTAEKSEASTNANVDIVNLPAGWPNSSLHGSESIFEPVVGEKSLIMAVYKSEVRDRQARTQAT